ncbi:hypothetical protein ACFL1H_05555, partial [Nanoarchaeota archaeon]
KIINNKLKNVEFNENDLKTFIYQSNLGLIEEQKIITGHFSGSLLQLLSERSNGITFYINGHGTYFPNLFAHSKLCSKDNLMVENFNGECICNNIANYGSSVNLIALLNNNGDYVGDGIASFKGYAKNAFFINNNGVHVAHRIGFKGEIKNTFILNNKGKWMGDIFSGGSKADLIFYANNIGRNMAGHIGDFNTKIKNLILLNNKSNSIGYGITIEKNHKIYLVGNEKLNVNRSFITFGYPSQLNIYSYNNKGKIVKKFANVTSGTEAISSYNQLIKQKNLQNIIKLADNPDQCTGEDFAKYLVKISEEIK